MFSNLIESNSHVREFKRRSSFFLITVAAYALILFAAGVAGVLTYDARVEAQTTDLSVLDWVPPVSRNVEPNRPRDQAPVQRPRQANAPVDRNLTESVRTQAVTTTNDPSRVPDNVSTAPSNVPPVVGPVRIGARNADPPPVIPDMSNCATCTATTPRVVETETPPTPATPPKPTTVRVSAPVILSKIIDLPKPAYPMIAKQARIQGPVNVQILIDETGRVISAQAVKGSAMLTKAAVDAALRARFTPTKLGDDPVKVSGVIVYNFVLQ